MATSTMFSSTMFFRETYRVRTGHEQRFVDLYKGIYSHGLAEHGLRRAGLWMSAPIQGDEVEYLALWEMKSGEQMMRLSKALDATEGGNPALQEARDEMSLLIERRDGWTLLGYEPTLNIEQMQAAGITAQTLLYEEIDIVPNQHPLFNRSVRANYLRMLQGSGLRLIGVLRPQLHSVEAVVMWDLQDGIESLAWLDRLDGQAEHAHWLSIAQASRTGARGRILHAA